MERLEVLKTYKIYIGGAFPRTESGRTYPLKDSKGTLLANMCLSSRKDVRNSVVAARKAFGGWSSKTAFNRGQILYRLAEMMEGRKAQLVDELIQMGATKANAEKEVLLSIDRCIYYAGWCDKYQALVSSVNPVSSNHFNFTVAEPSGVVGLIADEKSGLIGLISMLLPIIAGGNTCIVLASEAKAMSSITLAELINSSDIPGGVVNILTGNLDELAETFSTHMDINALVLSRESKLMKTMAENCVSNVKRFSSYSEKWIKIESQGLDFISKFQEYKTTWHPIEKIGGASGGY
ncbi:MAG: aldehyde dehydrogenase family protein [Crocinitomicaceae bacterium]|jgi:acyl-CoA reductase-like NAD-dependent aldehyde dehydrogenase|nr:aldehyde dehydrogenase family protein [Crocinitomicaceae bacterium]MDG2464100.1 aldehyde dehydrogenase family protein [Crocinitomicaceae bacterium]